MKKPELESILKRARLPEISGESLEMFPRQTIARLQRGAPPSYAPRRLAPRLVWAFGLMACIVIAFVIGHWSGRKESGSTAVADSLTSVKLIRETLSLFPNRVRAIVKDERGLNLILSDKPDVPDSVPIYVRISDGEHSSSLVTFSGQEIQIAGQKLTVLSQANGGIILEGSQFLWSDGKPVYAEKQLKIEAKNLDLASL